MDFIKIFSHKTNFYKLLIKQCKYTLDGGDALQRYFDTGDPEEAENLKKLEKDADNERKNLICQLDENFITPFEREDIFALSRAIDDILDYFNSTAKEMQVYKVEPTKELKEMVEVLREATMNVYNAVRLMPEAKNEAMEYALKAKKSENKVESLYRNNVAALFESDDIKYILKTREIYRHLSNCADVIDSSADIIEHILVKMI